MSKQFSYGREEKLKSRKMIDELFAKGRSFSMFPLKIIYLQPAEKLDFYIKTGVGASGRNFKRAVDRNAIKRLLREAYRTEKTVLHQFLQEKQLQVAIFILYIDKTLPAYTVLKAKMPFVFKRLIKELDANTKKNT